MGIDGVDNVCVLEDSCDIIDSLLVFSPGNDKKRGKGLNGYKAEKLLVDNVTTKHFMTV